MASSILSVMIVDFNPASTAGTFSFAGVTGVSVTAAGDANGPARVASVVSAVNSASSSGDSNIIGFRAFDLGNGYLGLAIRNDPASVPNFTTKANVPVLAVGGKASEWVAAGIVDGQYDPAAFKSGLVVGLSAARLARS
mgnify:CR=1 FL=1